MEKLISGFDNANIEESIIPEIIQIMRFKNNPKRKLEYEFINKHIDSLENESKKFRKFDTKQPIENLDKKNEEDHMEEEDLEEEDLEEEDLEEEDLEEEDLEEEDLEEEYDTDDEIICGGCDVGVSYNSSHNFCENCEECINCSDIYCYITCKDIQGKFYEEYEDDLLSQNTNSSNNSYSDNSESEISTYKDMIAESIKEYERLKNILKKEEIETLELHSQNLDIYNSIIYEDCDDYHDLDVYIEEYNTYEDNIEIMQNYLDEKIIPIQENLFRITDTISNIDEYCKNNNIKIDITESTGLTFNELIELSNNIYHRFMTQNYEYTDFNLNEKQLEEILEFENKFYKMMNHLNGNINPIIKNMLKNIKKFNSLYEIILEQKRTDNIIPEINIRTFIKEISQHYKTDIEFTKTAFDMIQTAAENYIIDMFQKSNLIAVNSFRDFI